MNDSNGLIWSHKVHFSNLAPGDSGTGTVTLTNTGAIDEWVSLEDLLKGPVHTVVNGMPSPDIFASYNNDNNPLSINYSVKIMYGSSPVSGNTYSGDVQTNHHPVNWLATPFPITLAEGPVQTGTLFLPSGYSAVFTYHWTFPKSAGNDYQNASGTLTMNADATQVKNNTSIR